MKVPAMQRQTRQNLETRYLLFVVTLILGAGGMPAARPRNSNGRWQLARGCPVMIELTQCQSRGNTTMTVVPLIKQIQQQPGNLSEPAVPPLQPAEPGTEVDVDDMQSVFGVLRAKENDVNNEVIDIVVDPPPEMNPDLSCKALLLFAWRRPTPHKRLGTTRL